MNKFQDKTFKFYWTLQSTMAITTIQLDKKTKTQLEVLKEYKRESFDDVLKKLLFLVPKGDDEGKYTNEFRAGLLDAVAESRNEKGIPLNELKKELGL